MADVTVTLTQEESNYINWVLGTMEDDFSARLTRLEDLCDESGTLTGRFGEDVQEIDDLVLYATRKMVVLARTLADKFPTD